jgi:UPF0716 protein FxsA
VRVLFLIFVIVPILEMVLLIKVGSAIGAITTVALVLLTAMVGINLIKRQGFEAMRSAQHKMNSGELPARELLDGLCLAVAGALLLTPGFVTDAFGFALLVPAFRGVLALWLQSRMSIRVQGMQSSASPSRGATIEGESERVD